MRIHIIGICGTFMGGVARLAQALGHQVSGSDANTYPPMSTQLEALGIDLIEGYRAENLPDDVETVIVGNTISRGNPELEAVLDKGFAYTSGAQWLGENVLQGRWVVAVAGTHGKTTTSSLVAWILQDNGLDPGYLIGGVPENFGQSARLGDSPFFVIEADEYDTAFSDKRSKFLHYRARTLVLNNLEFDHADIFDDLAAIQTQFQHLIKTLPQSALVIHNSESPALDQMLARGCWSEQQSFNSPASDWHAEKHTADGSEFTLHHANERYAVKWPLIGDHNVANAVAAIAAAHHVGVKIEHAIESLSTFKSVKRRMETLFDDEKVCLIDDFAHHPTAIDETLSGLRNRVGSAPIIAVLEPRSNTMKSGVHKDLIGDALSHANQVMIYSGADVRWDVTELQNDQIKATTDIDALYSWVVDAVKQQQQKTYVLVMSNGGFEGIYQRLIDGFATN